MNLDPHPMTEPTDTITPPDVRVYAIGRDTWTLCGPCARKRRSRLGGNTLEVSDSIGSICLDCQVQPEPLDTLPTFEEKE
jgi:hypothetical protein